METNRCDHLVTVSQWVVAIKEYSKLHLYVKLEPHYSIQPSQEKEQLSVWNEVRGAWNSTHKNLFSAEVKIVVFFFFVYSFHDDFSVTNESVWYCFYPQLILVVIFWSDNHPQIHSKTDLFENDGNNSRAKK